MVLVDSARSRVGRTDSPAVRRKRRPRRGHGQGGRRVAVRWRIRHKLLLGLGVVVGIIALLLTGTLQGLAAFTSTVKTADSKLAELHDLEKLKLAIEGLNAAPDTDRNLDE